MSLNVTKNSKLYLGIGIFVSFVSLVLVLVLGLNPGIDFSGGALFKYGVDNNVISMSDAESTLRERFEQNGLEIQRLTISDNFISIGTEDIEEDLSAKINNSINTEGISLESFESIGSVIGAETTTKSAKALLVSLIGILLYIAYSFNNIPKPYSSFKFGVAAMLAMVHDVLVVLGVFALLGYFLDVEIDLFFITALLTIIGFSVNDTIVVFDRLRENLGRKSKGSNLAEIVDTSINETLRRSVGTSMTVLFILLALFFYGGESIRYFVVAFIVGVVAGTYSSIFVASPIFVLWESNKKYVSSKSPKKKKSKSGKKDKKILV